MKFWEDQGYNKGESLYVESIDYDRIVENYYRNKEKSLAIKKEKLSPDRESSRVVDEESLSNKLIFSDDELAAIEACPSILVNKFGWKKIKHFYGFTCLIPRYYGKYNFSVPNPSYEENKHFFKDIKEVVKHLRRYGNMKPKTVTKLKKHLKRYGYKFKFTPPSLQKELFVGVEAVWTRKCSFKGKGWEKKIIDGEECIQRNDDDEDPLFLGKDYFFDIKQVADYIIENTEAEGPCKEDLVEDLEED